MNVKLSGWATISESFDKGRGFRSNTAFQKRHGFAQSISTDRLGDLKMQIVVVKQKLPLIVCPD